MEELGSGRVAQLRHGLGFDLPEPLQRSGSVPGTECSCSCISVEVAAPAGWMAWESLDQVAGLAVAVLPERVCREIGSLPYSCTSEPNDQVGRDWKADDAR